MGVRQSLYSDVCLVVRLEAGVNRDFSCECSNADVVPKLVGYTRQIWTHVATHMQAHARSRGIRNDEVQGPCRRANERSSLDTTLYYGTFLKDRVASRCRACLGVLHKSSTSPDVRVVALVPIDTVVC